MKKFALLSAALLCGSIFSAPAFAAENSAQVQIRAAIKDGCTVTTPGGGTIDFGTVSSSSDFKEQTAKFVVSCPGGGKAVAVSFDADGGEQKLTAKDGNTALEYEVLKGENGSDVFGGKDSGKLYSVSEPDVQKGTENPYRVRITSQDITAEGQYSGTATLNVVYADAPKS